MRSDRLDKSEILLDIKKREPKAGSRFLSLFDGAYFILSLIAAVSFSNPGLPNNANILRL